MTTATSRGIGERIAMQHGPALWTVAGLVLYVVGWMAAFFVVFAVEGVASGVGSRNGFQVLVWAAIVVGFAMPLGRRLVPGISYGLVGWVLLLPGVLLAAAATTGVEDFVRARYGVFDPEYAGLSLFAGPALVAISLASWAALAVPRKAALIPGVAALTAVVGLVLALLPSVPGARDGIDAESVPLVVTFGLGVAYGALAGLAVLRHVLERGRSTPG